MCVASYGVIPQTYIRAVPSGGTSSTSSPVAESATRTCGPRTGTGGTSGAGHARMRGTLDDRSQRIDRLSRATGDPPRGSERRPRDRRPPDSGTGEAAARDQPAEPPTGRLDLETGEQLGHRFAEVGV